MSKEKKLIKWDSAAKGAPERQINNYLLFWTWNTAAVSSANGYIHGYADGFQSGLQAQVSAISGPVECESGGAMTLRINRLVKKHLRSPLDILIEPDAEGFIASTPDLPLYGYGDDREEAISNLKTEIESLYEDLMGEESFSEEWLRVKEFLRDRVIN